MENEKIQQQVERLLAAALESQNKGEDKAAVQLYLQVLQYDRNQIKAYINLGLLYHKHNNLPQAAAYFEQAVRLNGEDSRLVCYLGRLLIACGKQAAGIHYLDKVLYICPRDWQALLEAGKAYKQCGIYQKAMDCFQQVLQLHPDAAAVAYVSIGGIYRDQNNLPMALRFFQEAVKRDPGAPGLHGLVADILLRSGNLCDGFREYEWRRLLPEAKETFTQFKNVPEWKGEIFSGKRLVVYAEQGLGDTLQFVRYLPQVKARGGWVTLLCQKQLVRLFDGCIGVDYITSELVGKNIDLCVPLLSLPRIFGTTVNTVPPASYLKVDKEITDKWKPLIKNDGVLKVGLVWSGNTYNSTITNRSCSLQDLQPLASVDRVAFYSLQMGEGVRELENPPAGLKITDLSGNISDFADTAGAVMNLDLVISIDTSVPHLVGGLGKPVWIVLPYESEWRWLMEREDSIWYSTVRLFRQQETGNWQAVFTAIADELKKEVIA